MQTFISKLNINYSSDFEFIEVEVSFYDEVTIPHPCADVTVFLQKDKNKTIDGIRNEAVQKARQYLESVLNDRSS